MIKLLISEEEFLQPGKDTALYRYVLGLVEKPLLERALQRAAGNQLKVARILGINRNTIRSKIRKLGIDARVYK